MVLPDEYMRFVRYVTSSIYYRKFNTDGTSMSISTIFFMLFFNFRIYIQKKKKQLEIPKRVWKIKNGKIRKIIVFNNITFIWLFDRNSNNIFQFSWHFYKIILQISVVWNHTKIKYFFGGNIGVGDFFCNLIVFILYNL